MTAFYSGFHPTEELGAKGSAAFTSAATNTATIYLYKRSATELTILDVPDGDVVYTFATAAIDLTAVTNGWTSTIPVGDDPLYVVTAFVGSNEQTVTIETNEWATPALLARSGLNTVVVFLYQRNNTGVAPSGVAVTTTYTFSTGGLAGSYSPWTQTIPESSGGRFLFITTATAVSESDTAELLTSAWSPVRLFSIEGESPSAINLTNDSVSVPANTDGSSPNLTGATTTVTVFEGGQDVTGSWTITATPSGGVTGSLVGNNYTVTGLANDTGTVTFTATRSGYLPLSAVFSLAKAKAGVDGTPAIVYEVRSSQGVIKRTNTGSYTSPTITFSAFSTTGSAAPVAYAGRFIIATSTDGVNYTNRYTSSVNESTYTYTILASVNFVRVRLYLAGGTTTLVDEEVIPVADDGAAGLDGDDGAPGAPGTPAVTGFLTNESASVFAYANGIVVSYAGLSGQFRIFSGTTDVSTSFTLSSFSNPQSLSVVYSGQTYTVTGGLDANENTASLTIRATGSGSFVGVTIDKVFTLSKTTGGYEIVTSLPAIGDPRRFDGSIVFLEPQGKLYRFDGFAWTGNVAQSAGYIPDPLFNDPTFWSSETNDRGPVLLRIYRRSATSPTGPSVTATYDFTTGVLSGLNNSWTTTVPVGTDPLWVRTAVAYNVGTTTDTVGSAEWSPSVEDTAQSGISVPAVPLLIYRRNSTSPARPSVSATYTFATGVLSGLNNSWTTAIPETTGNLWVSKATAHNTTATDAVLSTEWSVPIRGEVSKWYLDTNSAGTGLTALGATRGYALSSFVSGSITTVVKLISSNVTYNGVGEQLRLRARVWNNSNQIISVIVEFYNSANTLLSSITANSAASSGVLTISEIGTVPSGTAYFRTVVQNAGGTALGGTAIVTDIKLDPAASSDMIPPSAIIADKIAAGAVTAAKIGVTELSAITANVGTLTAGTIRNGADTFRVDVSNGRTIVQTGAFMKVSGSPFGSSNQFIEWYGPFFANLTSCTEANSTYYLKTDGSAYFGGSLSAGILKNAVQTTSLANNASVETGNYGSNGGTIQIILSYYAYSETGQIFYDATNEGLNDWEAAVTAWGAPVGPTVNASKSVGTNGTTTIALDRSVNNGAFTNGVTTLTISNGTETIVGTRPTPGDAPGNLSYTRTYSGSLTYTDPQTIAQNRNYRARITARGLDILGYSLNQQQRVGIVSTE
jgi:hypothetical protein